MITLERVVFAHSSGFKLGEVNLDIAQGSFLSIIGPNGSGKTTLLRLICGSLPPQDGAVRLEGRDLLTFSRRELARRMAVILSEQFFEFPFPAYDVVAMGRYPHLGRFQTLSGGDHEIVRRSMERTGTAEFRGRPVSQLSSGERQRVLLARAVAQEPSILILDEPNTHLDIHHQLATFQLLQALNRDSNLTVIVVLHDLTMAAAFSRSVLLLHEGRVLRFGSPSEVITEELIRSTYGVDVIVQPDPTGAFPHVFLKPNSF